MGGRPDRYSLQTGLDTVCKGRYRAVASGAAWSRLPRLALVCCTPGSRGSLLHSPHKHPFMREESRPTPRRQCKVDFWCEGANECHEDREGIACAECKDGFYAVGDFCERCPDTSWRMILLFLAFVLILSAGFMQLVQYSQYTSATQFSKDLAIRDQPRVEPTARGCWRWLGCRECVNLYSFDQ